MLTALLLVPAALAATLTVGPDGDHATLDEALAAASSGDTLLIAEGTYAACLDLGGRSLTLEGAGAEATLLDGSGCESAIVADEGESLTLRALGVQSADGRAVAVVGGALLLSEVALTGGSATMGGLVHLDGGGALEVVDSALGGGQASWGGALWVGEGGRVTLSGSALAENGASEGGGAVHLESGASLEMEGGALRSNTAVRGGAIHAPAGASLALDGVEASANQASEHGGLVYAEGELTLELSGGSYTENAALYGSGGLVWLYGGGELTLSGTTVSGSSAWESGGALYLDYGVRLYITDSTLAGNQSTAGDGGVLWQSFYGELALDGVTLSSNTARGDGGALALEFLVGEARLDGVSLDGNQSLDGSGGAIWTSSTLDLRVADSVFTGNTAAFSGGALALDPAGLIEISGSELAENRAEQGSGGAISLDAWEEGVWWVSLDRLTLSSNTAGADGGAVSAQGLAGLALGSATLEGNQADLGGLGRDGGALHAEAVGALSVTRTRFCTNSAGDGGAVSLLEVESSEWRNVAWLENVASGQGGAVRAEASALTVLNADLLGNVATEGAISAEASTLVLVNDLLAWSTGGALVGDEASRDASTVAYDAWYGNDADAGGAFALDGEGHVLAEPGLAAWAGGDCAADLSLLADSPLIDAGDPTLYDGGGSRSDIGITGGPLEEGQRAPDEEDSGDSGGEGEGEGEGEDTGGKGEDGCGCASGGGAGGAGWALLAALAARRRPRRG